MGRQEDTQAVLVECPRCHETEIIYVPKEPIPRCPDCDLTMQIREVIDEGPAS